MSLTLNTIAMSASAITAIFRTTMRRFTYEAHKLIVLVVVIVLFGGVSYGYGTGGSYPYRTYSMPGVGGLLVILLILYLLGVFR